MSRTTLALAALTILLLPACALERGPVGLPVTFKFEEKLTGTETHEVDFNRVSRDAALAAAPSQQLLRDEAAFNRSSAAPTFANWVAMASPAPTSR